jgi:hypothetical protein
MLSSSDFTFFVQGSPHEMTAKNIEEWMNLVYLEGLDHTYNFRIGSPNEFLSSGRCFEWAGKTKPSNCAVMEWCTRHVKKNPSELIPIFWNACFGVSNKLIAKSSINKYVNIIQNELNDINPECGHYCERLWYYIFNIDMSNKKCISKSYAFFGGSDGNRHYGILRLNEDGTIGIYSNFNEKFWTLDNDSITFYNAEKIPTCVLNKIEENEYMGVFTKNKSIKHRIKLCDDDFWKIFSHEDRSIIPIPK